MRAHSLILLLLLVAACGTPVRRNHEPLVEKSGPYVPPALAEADEALRQHIVDTQLTAVGATMLSHEDVLRAMLRWKTNRGRARTAPFEAVLTREASPDLSEFALLRLSQHDLNLACEMAALAAPGHLSPHQQEIFRDMLLASAFRQLLGVRAMLDDAAALNGPRRDRVTALRAMLPKLERDVPAACTRTREAWAPPVPAALDEVASSACQDGEPALCWVWGESGTGGEAAMELACEGDVVRACLTLATRHVSVGASHSDPTETLRAEELYGKTCTLGSELGCRQEVAVVVPSHRETYQRGCVQDGDPIACLKLARVLALERPSPLWWECSDEHATESSTSCEDGDPVACIRKALAAPLVTTGPHVIRVPVAETPADLQETIVSCGEGVKGACWQAARALVEKDNRTCATVMMLEGCSGGDTDACGLPEPK